MPAKKATKKSATKKTSKGRPAKRRTMNIPEAQRHTDRIVLRLDPHVAARLRAIAAKWHVTLAEVVTDALDVLMKGAPKTKK